MKNTKPASAYAKPHTMAGSTIDGTEVMAAGEYSTTKSAREASLSDPIPSGPSYGTSKGTKTSGIEMRGAGCATKGKMSRGPMA